MRTTAILLSTAFALSAGSSITPRTTPGPVPAEIVELDRCIQNRFVDRRAMGMRRVLPLGYHGVLTFRPENHAETTVIEALKAKDYEVVFSTWSGAARLGKRSNPG